MEITLDEALMKGIEAHKAGQIQEADRIYSAVLQAQPKHPDANHNMGVLAAGAGKDQEALPFFKKALEANPHNAQFWFSYIDALLKLGRIAAAKTVLNQAKGNGAQGEGFDQLEKRINELDGNVRDTDSGATTTDFQNPPQDQLQPLINLYSKGQLQQALSEANQLQQQFPNSIVLYNILGAANAGLGNFDTAISSYKQALKIKPDYAEAYNNMGFAQKDTGDLEAALDSYKQALKINPNHAGAYNNMGVAHHKKSDLEAAINSYKQALKINPDYAEAYYNLGNALNGTIFSKPASDLQEIIIPLLTDKNYARPVEISKAVISLLKFEPVIIELFQKHSAGELKYPFDQLTSNLHGAPLLFALMSVCPLPDLEFEDVFTSIRSALLSSISENKTVPKVLSLQTAVALQCFINEYIYNQTDKEIELVKELELSITREISTGQQPSPHSILCLASYNALHNYEWADLLSVTTDIQDVLTQQILEPKQEEELKPKIQILNKITDETSSKVREQYEESPYPRWIKPGLFINPSALSKVVSESNLRLFSNRIDQAESPAILIAGCGTGQHSIGTAARFLNSKVLAVDLSLASLAYAQRKTKELGFQNIEYLQADILDLGKLDRQFDIVESSGVLHHMSDPMAGWKILTDCLKPGGLMNIGLYSELARQHIVTLREHINHLDIEPSAAAMKSFRNEVINSDTTHHNPIINTPDFYSLSELRDLLFHVQEHRFTLTQIQTCLDDLGLKFCGFGTDRIVNNFKLTNVGPDDAYDLQKWHSYEESNPHTFTGMYQFWCQKVN